LSGVARQGGGERPAPAIQPNGTVGAPTTAVSATGSTSGPLLNTDGGLLVFYGAITPSPGGVDVIGFAAAAN
jgi:hypothetical protein